MKAFAKDHWKTLLFFAVICIFGGFFTGIYLMDSYPDSVQQEILAQGLNDTLLGVITALQSAGYGVVLGAVGIWLGQKTGLWKGERSITRGPLGSAVGVALFGGFAMIFADLWFFGRYSRPILDSYSTKPSVPYLIGMVTYGGVIEEVMLRLFLMTLIVFVLHKLFGRKQETPALWILIAANVISALLFAAGHLPTTFVLLGSSPMILFRCFLLNGGIGLLFGRLYRKYGLRYAMLAHGGCHVVSKLIRSLFL